MPSFDVVSEVNKVELNNAIDQSNKEISTRFDFKGSDAHIELKDLELTLYADNDFQLAQVKDVLIGKLTKRGVDTRSLGEGKLEKVSGNKLKEIIKIQNGIEQDQGKKLVKAVKDSKLKVQASIQGETVRITGTKRDDLQEAILLLKKDIIGLPLQFINFRD